jgi:hypothetical protein
MLALCLIIAAFGTLSYLPVLVDFFDISLQKIQPTATTTTNATQCLRESNDRYHKAMSIAVYYELQSRVRNVTDDVQTTKTDING